MEQKNYTLASDKLFFRRNFKDSLFRFIFKGEYDLPDVSKLRLSDAFINPDESKEFEWTATVININKDHNQELQKTCKALYDYSCFVTRIRENIKPPASMTLEDSVNEAVEYAIKHNFLEGYFAEEKGKIVFDILTEFDKENYDWNRRDEGRIAGEAKKAVEAAVVLVKKYGVTPEQAAEDMGADLEKLLKALNTETEESK